MMRVVVISVLLAASYAISSGSIRLKSVPTFRRADLNSILTLRGGISGSGTATNADGNVLDQLRVGFEKYYGRKANALGGGDDGGGDDDSSRSHKMAVAEEGGHPDRLVAEEPEQSIDQYDPQLKDLWSSLFVPSLPEATIQATVVKAVGLDVVHSNFTDEEALYSQLLGQFVDPLTVGGKRVQWLLQETALNLKGLAVLAHNPHLSRAELADAPRRPLQRTPRAVSISVDSAFALPAEGRPDQTVSTAGTQTLQTALVKALCHSTRSVQATLSVDSIAKIRQLATLRNITRDSLSTVQIVKALLDALTALDRPATLVLSGSLERQMLSDGATLRLLTDAIQRPSKLLFLALPPVEELSVGQVPPSLVVAPSSGSGGTEADSPPAPFTHLFSPFSPPPPFSDTQPPASSPQPFTPFPFSAAPAYTVVVRNGSASVSAPPNLPPLPPQLLQSMIAEAKSKGRETAVFTGSISLPGRGALSPEDMTRILNNPEERQKFMDTVKSLNERLEQEMGSKDRRKGAVLKNSGLARRAAKKSNSRTQSDYGGEGSDQSKGASEARAAFVDSFEKVLVAAPRDHQLRSQWQRIVDDEMSGRIVRVNKKAIQVQMKRADVRMVPGSLRRMRDVLRRRVMSAEEVARGLQTAVRLQAAQFDFGLAGDVQGEEKAAPPTAAATEIVLTHWALDSAFGAELQVPTPRLGRPVARSREDLAALSLDKYEKVLVGNVIQPQDISVSYDQIGGLEEAKSVLRQSITYPLKYPRLYQEGVAAEAVKGVLLFGPPGTGKTMLAKAVATEGGATFLTVDASTIENKWLGESEKNAKAVFSLARKLAPCVVYLDEVDSVLSSREHGDDSSHGTLTAVKTTLMQEWDGLRTTKDRVVVIASTNRPFDLDEAVLRRLPRRIMVDLPDQATREEILSVTLRKNRVAADVNMTVLANQLEGYTGSDIKEVCREAVVRVSHERAHQLETGQGGADQEQDWDAPLREVTLADFKAAMSKMKASVNDNGSALRKVIEWNEKFGEVKRSETKAKRSSSLSMYV